MLLSYCQDASSRPNQNGKLVGGSSGSASAPLSSSPNATPTTSNNGSVGLTDPLNSSVDCLSPAPGCNRSFLHPGFGSGPSSGVSSGPTGGGPSNSGPTMVTGTGSSFTNSQSGILTGSVLGPGVSSSTGLMTDSATYSLMQCPTTYTLSPVFQRLAQPSTVQDVVAAAFSHHQLASKNSFIIHLLEALADSHEVGLVRELKDCLTLLTQFGKSEHACVALAARRLLIMAQTPAFELRRNQESFLQIMIHLL
ncbi:unnamed protein product [Protopolystoma xenopodis]|uniref:Acetyl-CoA carboxylase central domain-containing protein n=1 Tax=Protopolystoma xenopodis TaxID=117903 RepID=A0A3S5BCX7_9PLAT|nr:unnamed protein product [Protopolystoma xenopodis]